MFGEILSSNFVILIIIPTVIVFAILWACKYYGVSFIPKSFKKRKRKKFALPNLTRKKMDKSGRYIWTVEDEIENPEEAENDIQNEDVNYEHIKRENSVKNRENMYN